MSRIYLTKRHTALTLKGMLQTSRKNEFLSGFPKFPKDHDFLNQVLSIASICIQSNPIQGDLVDEFLAFLGTIYLPRLIKERNNDPMTPRALWMHTYVPDDDESILSIPASKHRMLSAHIGSAPDLEFKTFLEQNCQFLLELCRKPAESIPALVPITPRTNLELQLVLVDRALEAQSKASVSTKMEGKMEDNVKGEVLGKVLELAGSIKSVIEVAANGSDSLERPSKKRKGAPK